jgi:hypothetical protein
MKCLTTCLHREVIDQFMVLSSVKVVLYYSVEYRVFTDSTFISYLIISFSFYIYIYIYIYII